MVTAGCSKPVEETPPPVAVKPSVEVEPISHSDIMCLATNIYHEARGEPLEGQLAVGYVTLNRVESEKYPNTVCDVVYQAKMKSGYKTIPARNKCQFSWYCDGRPDHVNHKSEGWTMAQKAAIMVLSKSVDDMTDGALYYHANYVSPRWSRTKRTSTKIGNHIFYY